MVEIEDKTFFDIKKHLGVIKKEEKELMIKNLKFNVIINLLLLILISIIMLKHLSVLDPSFKLFWKIIYVILGIFISYIVFIEEALFMRYFFNLEKKYYIWKKYKNNEAGYPSGGFSFHKSLDTFQIDILSKITGFKINTIGHKRRGIFNFRITKVKKEIDIFFNLMIDLLFGKELLDRFDAGPLKNAETSFEYFLEQFKSIFIRHPDSLNLIALDSFFSTLNKSLKKEYPQSYKYNEKVVSDYYNQIEKISEQRAERKSEIFKTVIAMLITLILAIISYPFISVFYPS